MPNSIAFTIAGISVKWYGIIIAFAMLIGIIISTKRSKIYGINPDYILELAIIVLPVSVIGARLYFVIFKWSDYAGDISKIINIRNGGMAIHGGLIFGLIAGLIYCKYKGINPLKMADLLVPVIALGQSMGRWGNYLNGEAHGGPTNLPWAIEVNGEMVHPTFLYESIWCLLIFLFLMWLDHYKRFIQDNRLNSGYFFGQISCLYLGLYSIERFFVEGLRTDSLMLGSLRQAQVLSLVLISIALIGYWYLHKKEKNNNEI